jgi:putative membrane protein
MNTLIVAKARADLRDYLAEERTFLAWIRTGLAVMAFGFAVARVGPFLEESQVTQGAYVGRPHPFSVWFGTALLVAGVTVNLLSTRRHMRLVAELNRGQLVDHGPSRQAINLAWFLALAGAAMAIYLRVA